MNATHFRMIDSKAGRKNGSDSLIEILLPTPQFYGIFKGNDNEFSALQLNVRT